jgi:hypothetical protein
VSDWDENRNESTDFTVPRVIDFETFDLRGRFST